MTGPAARECQSPGIQVPWDPHAGPLSVQGTAPPGGGGVTVPGVRLLWGRRVHSGSPTGSLPHPKNFAKREGHGQIRDAERMRTQEGGGLVWGGGHVACKGPWAIRESGTGDPAGQEHGHEGCGVHLQPPRKYMGRLEGPAVWRLSGGGLGPGEGASKGSCPPGRRSSQWPDVSRQRELVPRSCRCPGPDGPHLLFL